MSYSRIIFWFVVSTLVTRSWKLTFVFSTLTSTVHSALAQRTAVVIGHVLSTLSRNGLDVLAELLQNCRLEQEKCNHSLPSIQCRSAQNQSKRRIGCVGRFVERRFPRFFVNLEKRTILSFPSRRIAIAMEAVLNKNRKPIIYTSCDASRRFHP